MKVIISEWESSIIIRIETKKYLRYIQASKSRGKYLSPVWSDIKFIRSTKIYYIKFKNEWVEIEKLKKLLKREN